MATNMFMKLRNGQGIEIKGEAEDVNHKDWCEITNLEHEFKQGASPLKSDQPPQTGDTKLKVTKFNDIATTEILKVCWLATTLPKVEIECCRADGSNEPVDYLKIELENVVISKCALEAKQGSLPTEKLEFDYTTVKYTYKAIDKHTGRAPGRKFTSHDREVNED